MKYRFFLIGSLFVAGASAYATPRDSEAQTKLDAQTSLLRDSIDVKLDPFQNDPRISSGSRRPHSQGVWWVATSSGTDLSNRVEIELLPPLSNAQSLRGDQFISRSTSIWFRVEPLVSPQEYTRIKASNHSARTEMSMLLSQIQKAKIPVSYGYGYSGFQGRTPTEVKMITHYESLRKSIYVLPDFYTDDASIRFLPSEMFPHPPGFTRGLVQGKTSIKMSFRQIMTEYVAVSRLLLNSFHRYEQTQRSHFEKSLSRLENELKGN